MLNPVNVSLADYIQAVKSDRASHVRITFLGQNIVLTDEDIEASGLTVQWYLNSDTDLTMGRAMMATVQMPVLNSAKVEPLIWGGEFTLEIGQEVNNTTEWTLLGFFQGNRPSKIHSVKVIDFTAHDRMNQFDVPADDWVSSLTFPMTVADIYHSLCDYCGIEYVSGDELPNIMSRSYAENPIRLTGVLCRDVLAQIAEACCCYARINTEGKCQLVWYADHSSDYSLTGDDEYPPVESFDNVPPKRWSDLANVTWNQLSGVTWQDLEGTREAFRIAEMNIVDTIANAKYYYPYDTGRVAYMIVDNPFLAFDGESQPYIQDIYNRLQAFGGYLPISVDCVGNALIEVGDVITVTIDGESVTMPIFCKTLTWNGGMVDHYEATGNLQRQEVSPENMVKLNEAGRYKLAMGQIELIARNKYDKQSNILIEPDGITVSGGKYVKIESGGTFDVDSENFVISSENKMFRSGRWYFHQNGIEVAEDPNDENSSYAMLSTYSQSSILWETSGFRMECATWDDMYSTYRKGFGFFGSQTIYASDYTAHYGIDFSPGGTISEDRNSGCGTLGAKNPWHEVHAYEMRGIRFVVRPSGKIISQQNDSTASIGEENNPFPKAVITNLAVFSIIPNGVYSTVGYPQSPFDTIYGTDIYGTLHALSSREIKHDIKPICSKGSAIDKLKPVSFIYNTDKRERIHQGLIYEETVKILPEICEENKDGVKTINYVELVPILLKETQELRKRVAELEKRVNDLERR